MLRVKDDTILDPSGKKIFLRGVNFGGWLMKEAYFMHSPSFAERKFRKVFASHLGDQALSDFDQKFRDNFICETDIKDVASWGFNCIRVPFHYNVVESRAFQHQSAGLKYLDAIVEWAERVKIYLILDLHAVPGCQNQDWHSDSLGKSEFFDKPAYRKRAYALWQHVARRYKDCQYLAGYDLLNESVTDRVDVLNDYYHHAIKAIRREDQKHILFIEGNNWATDIACLDEFEDDNYALSIHTYEPMNMTFNLIPLLTYPSTEKPYICHKKSIQKHLRQYADFAKQRRLPLFVGEFGVNYRANQSGEMDWLKDNLEFFKTSGFHWTYWTYKAVKNWAFPDGICSYYDNPEWVHRQGPLSGWDTYHLHWPSREAEMVRSWRTSAFKVNQQVLQILQEYAR